MVFRYPLNRFVITAGVIGMSGSIIGIILLRRAQYRVLKKPYCKKALDQLQQNLTAVELIGKPIEIVRPDVIDKKQIFGATITDINLPFKGSKKSGMLHIIADRKSIVCEGPNNTKIEKLEDEWNIKRLELRFD